MEFHLQFILTCFLVVVSHASSLSDLTKRPFPKAMRNLLMHSGANSISTAGYNTVYVSNPKRTGGRSLLQYAYGSNPKRMEGSSISTAEYFYGSNPKRTRGTSISSAGSYDAVYGSNPKRSGGSSVSTAGYDAVYGSNPKRTGGRSLLQAGYDAVYGSNPKRTRGTSISSAGSYDAVYGSNPKRSGGSSVSTARYDAVYGSNPKRIEGSSTSTTGYDAVYGSNPKRTGGRSLLQAGYDAVYGSNPKTTRGTSISSAGSYDAVYGSDPKRIGGSSVSTAQYDAVYGSNPKRTGGRSLLQAGYDAVYGSNPKTAGGSSINPNKDFSLVSGYRSAYGGSSEQGRQDDAGADGNAGNVFLEKDLRPGTKVNVRFTKTARPAHFLPHQVAQFLPFSSDKLPEILSYFSVKENSPEAKIIEKSIKKCEEAPVVGEEKHCARSLESLTDFCSSKLGENIRVITNVGEGETQEYKFEEGAEMVGEKSVVCHQLDYPYAVAYCHVFSRTKIYRIPLVGADGTKVKALAVCHDDTSAWDPAAMAFRVLKVKPGTLPICHFIPTGHFVWLSN